MAIPNGVRPQKAETAGAPADAMAGDAASEADSAGWETASNDDDTDAVAAQASATADVSGAKNAEAASRMSPGPTASQQSMDTSATTYQGADSSAAAGDEAASAQQFEEWDLCRSLFDNHVSASLEANLEYMFKHFGFYLPDAAYLSDPAGLINYLVRLIALS